MAGKPKNFQAISNVLANYNFVDIASGTGYINFYAGKTVDLFPLSNFTYYSDVVLTTSAAFDVSAASARLDIDFDTVMNRPLDIKGIGIVNIPVALSSASGSTWVDLYAKVTLRKWDGVTETDIVTNNSRTYRYAGAITYTMFAVDLTVPSRHFKIGETLRLTIELMGAGDGSAGNRFVYLGHDPKNRTTGWDTSGATPSQLMFQCPVRLSL